MSGERIVILVTHLLGAGHFVRAAALGRALAEAGHPVTLVTGGAPTPVAATEGMQLVQLPPVLVKGTAFTNLLTPHGEPADAGYLARRAAIIADTVARTAPACLIVELYPFGRRVLRLEFRAAIAAARALRPRPAILSSIRDVLAPPVRPAKVEFAEAELGRDFDGVLVHGDAAVIPLAASWPVSTGLARRLLYTGYVEDMAHHAGGQRMRLHDESRVVVSGGGGEAGLPLFEAALLAARLPRNRFDFHILVGHGVDAARFERLRAGAAGTRAIVERARRDFRDLLAGAAVSVSRAGYNTILDIAATGTACLLVPFTDGGEEEQRLRAEALAERGLAVLLPEAELSAESLLAAIGQAGRAGGVAPFAAKRDGAPTTVALLPAILNSARARDQALTGLEAALNAARLSGRKLEFWWRDDDAVAPSAALDRLLALRARFNLPLAIATIPARAMPDLATRLRGEADVAVLPHGFSHANHAPAGGKKQELLASRGEAMLAELRSALRLCVELFGAQAAPLLTPPWNRLDAGLLDLLPELGFRGLSAFRGRYDDVGPASLVRIDTHIDPVDWQGGGGSVAPTALLADMTAWAKRMTAAGRPAPIGILSHHLRHDAWIWGLLEESLEMLAESPAVAFVDVRDVLHRTDSENPHSERVAIHQNLS